MFGGKPEETAKTFKKGIFDKKSINLRKYLSIILRKDKFDFSIKTSRSFIFLLNWLQKVLLAGE